LTLWNKRSACRLRISSELIIQADQIASLYDLLTFKDQPNSQKERSGVKKSVPDILRMVKETLGEEGLKRLQEDGIVRKR
jgi:hypothetical protein